MEEKKTDKRHDFGRHCEFMARTYLEQQGYLILETNWRSGHKEIDIIATKDNIIAFIEVKTRSTVFKDPTDAVDAKKIRRIAKAADSFMQTFDIKYEPQFDIITIIGTPQSEFKLTHYPDAFMPPLTGAW